MFFFKINGFPNPEVVCQKGKEAKRKNGGKHFISRRTPTPSCKTFFHLRNTLKKGFIGVFWEKRPPPLMEDALNAPHTIFIPSLDGKKGKKPLNKSQNPYDRYLLLSGKVQVPGQGRWTEQLLHLQDVNFNHIYSNIPR